MSNYTIIWGGDSPEAESSYKSATNVAAALSRHGVTIPLIEYDSDLEDALSAFRGIALPLTHGGPGESGPLQRLLGRLSVPYVGSGPEASEHTFHKPTGNRILAEAGIPVPRGVVIHRESVSEGLLLQVWSELGPGVVVKPCSGGSSAGVRLCSNADDLLEVVRKHLVDYDELLIEEQLDGQEFTVGVAALGGAVRALVPIDVTVPPSGSRVPMVGDRSLRPRLAHDEIGARLRSLSVEAFKVLDCRDWARVDLFAAPNGQATVLEVNTIPGVTPSSPFPRALESSGYELGSFFLELLGQAGRRRDLT